MCVFSSSRQTQHRLLPVAPISVFTHIWSSRGMPHIGEPGAKLRRLCALFSELFYVGELSASALLNHISPSAWCRTNPYAQLKRDPNLNRSLSFGLHKTCHTDVVGAAFEHICSILPHFSLLIQPVSVFATILIVSTLVSVTVPLPLRLPYILQN